MRQPWIHKFKTDFFFIIGPSFFVLAVIFLFQDFLSEIENKYSFYTWLFLIVFIDVAHVYATLFKTYFVKKEFEKRKKLLTVLPLLCFLIGFILFAFGSIIFWSFLAYVAVYHFIRQQYGFMRLYSRQGMQHFLLCIWKLMPRGALHEAGPDRHQDSLRVAEERPHYQCRAG